MFDKSCIFCRIIDKQIVSKVVKENEHVLVIEDIAPKAPIHYLIIPKKHVINLSAAHDEDLNYGLEMLRVARDISKTLKQPAAFNLISNHGASSGQSVFHWHCHFLSGRNIYDGGLTL